jgi:hypothetical protein
MSAGGQAVPEYFAKSVEFSVHQREGMKMAGEIASFVSKGRETGTEQTVGEATNAWIFYAKMC